MILDLATIIFMSPLFAKEPAAKVCPSGKHYVHTHFRRGYVRGDGKIVSSSNIKGHCRTNPEGFSTWQPKLLNSSPPGWPHKIEKFKNWSVEETERVLEVLGDLPSSLLSSNIKTIYRAEKSKDFPNPASSADGIIVLYDSAFDAVNNLTRILAHELAHQKYLDLNQSDRESYWYPLNWIPIDRSKGVFVSRKEGYIQDDGRESPEEDFANNVESFLFESEKLKYVTPQAYKWIKTHFGDNFKLGWRK